MTPLPAYDANDPAAYVASRLALVGDRDPVPLLAAAPDRIADAVTPLSDNAARRPEAPGAWSALQVVRHLADSEIVYGYRLRVLVAAAEGRIPDIPGYDQEAWAERLHTHRGTLDEAVEDYAAGRRMTVRFLHTLTEADWAREGHHSERGHESVRQIVTLLAAHDMGHERQIVRIRETLGA